MTKYESRWYGLILVEAHSPGLPNHSETGKAAVAYDPWTGNYP